MQRTLVVIGILILVVGLLWPWIGKIPLGRLPGDIIISKPNVKIYIPIGTMIVVSIAVSLILWLIRKF
ncbi:MAG: DUF2905 domain-containing protein [Deltaproteobacteria bacterium]|nr:DUF2905 domain-containing protein [Deltaproteobacteria bacterium]